MIRALLTPALVHLKVRIFRVLVYVSAYIRTNDIDLEIVFSCIP